MAKRTTSKKAKAGKAAPKAEGSEAKAAPARSKAAKVSSKTARAASKSRVSAPANRSSAKGASVRKDKASKGKNAKVEDNTKTGLTTGTKREASSARKEPGNDGTMHKRAPRAKLRPIKERKTRLSTEELEEFRQMLLDKRRELVGDVNHLEDEAIRASGHGGGGPSAMPIHMADLGSDTWEQELTLGLIANERGLLREIDEALERIDNKTYGICLATGKVITKARLRAQPWAKFCIEYARKRELGLI